METMLESKEAAAGSGRFLNTGDGNCLQIIDLRHPVYVAAIEPDTAFWTLIEKGHLAQALSSGEIAGKLKKHFRKMSEEMETLRFGLTPSAVYFNPTEQCNLNCTYCYIPEARRLNGRHMTWAQMEKALRVLRDHFAATMPRGTRKPQIVFHGSEPLMNKGAVFRAIEEYAGEFDFGIQTNATLLEQEDFRFIVSHNVALGVSLDGHTRAVADRHRKNWAGNGTFRKVVKAVEMCRDYPLFNVICTVTSQNVRSLVRIVEFFHGLGLQNCLVNQVRCTLEGGRAAKPSDREMARMFIAALDRTFELYRETGRKLVIGNFANILLGIVAPTARRLMCDISPCGGGRCFFAVSAEGDVYPCSEFIGLPRFKGGNLFEDGLPAILASEPFKVVTSRKVENITPCSRCAIRHFCGAPCPAEAYQAHGSMEGRGAFCEFYEDQVRYAMRLIADGRESAYLWDNWDRDTKEMFRL